MDTRKDLADYLGMSLHALTAVLYSKPRKAYYLEKTIKKSNGKDRQIHSVSNPLKYLQSITLQKLSQHYFPSNSAHGFVKNHSIFTNASYHVNKRVVIKLDIEDFFPSITYSRVRGMFLHYPFNFGKEAATALAQICCLDDENGAIPQGASTSPYIANMICRKMDAQLRTVAQKYKMHYTRYADDLAFSTNKFGELDNFFEEVTRIINSSGFRINDDKTRIMMQHHRQAIAGLIVNEGINVNRKYLRNLRATLHNCEKYGVKSQVVRKVFKDQRNSRCKVWEVADQWVNQDGNPIDVSAAKKKFLLFLKGKIEFFGQVAFYKHSEREIVETQYSQKLSPKQRCRLQQFMSLLERWITIARYEQGEPFVRKSQARVEQLYRALGVEQEIIILLRDKSINELQELISRNAVEDPRFLLFDLPADNVEELRSEVARLLSEPCPSPANTKATLSELKIHGKFLHDLTHQNYKTTRKKFIREMIELRKGLTLPPNLLKIILSLNELMFKLPQNDMEVNLWEEASDKLKDFKRNIRLADTAIEECTNFDNFVNDIIMKVHSAYPRDIEIFYDSSLGATLYTDVERFGDTLRWILTSMIKNTISNKIYIKQINKETDEDHFYFEIFDDRSSEILIEPSRKFVNGKIKSAMTSFLGLGDYWIDANFKGYGWKHINLYHAKDITDAEELRTGFTHILRLPRI